MISTVKHSTYSTAINGWLMKRAMHAGGKYQVQMYLKDLTLVTGVEAGWRMVSIDCGSHTKRKLSRECDLPYL